jgi:hypothetical protein
MMNDKKKQTRSNLRRIMSIFVVVVLVFTIVALFKTKPAVTHGFPVIDGAFTGDWCAPNNIPSPFGPDSLNILTPPGCPLGVEFLWDDFDTINYGPPDTMGWLLGGLPGGPIPDPEIDINFFATTADTTNVFFAIEHVGVPMPIHPAPHVQIAIDLDGPQGGNPFWYDPPPFGGTGGLGFASLPNPLFADYLITTDVMAGTAFVWEATSVPGAWTLVGPAPLGWSGPGAPDIIEIAVPWGMFAPGPPFGLGIPAFITMMSAHSRPFAGPSDAPMTPEDDVFTELGAGFTTSPDICPPSPPSADCELFLGPGGGAGSADAYIQVMYPIPIPTNTSTPTSTATPTPTGTATATSTTTSTSTSTPTSTETNTPTTTSTETTTPSPTGTMMPTGTATPTSTETLLPNTATLSPTPTSTVTPGEAQFFLPIVIHSP